MGSRLLKLGLGQEQEEGDEYFIPAEPYLTSCATGQDGTLETRTSKPYRTVKIEVLLQEESATTSKKHRSGSGSSGLDRPAPKREIQGGAIVSPLPFRPAKTLPAKRKEKVPRKKEKAPKKVSEMTGAEGIEIEIKKGQRKQLKMIRDSR